MLEKFNNRKNMLLATDNISRSLCSAVNTTRFLRKKLGREEIDRLLPLLDKYISRNDPIPFVMLWGVGKKKKAGRSEEHAVYQLQKLDRTIRTYWPTGMALTIIYADVHGQMNRFSKEDIEKYYQNLRAFFKMHAPFLKDFLKLSDLRNKFGINTGLMEQMRKQSVEYKRHPCFRDILRNTKLHFQGNDENKGALEYIAARLLDRQIIECSFNDYIYLTYNRPEFSFLQPDLLTLYTWSLKKGRCRAPWYSLD